MPKFKPRPQLQPKPVLYIYCEGKNTEPNYLNGYIGKKYPGALIKVKKSTYTSPVEIVEEVASILDCGRPEDEGWAVYDREAESAIPDSVHAEARNKAGIRINIAISNICFEVWLLIHFQTSCRAHCSFESLSKDRDFKKHLPNYDKGVCREYSDKEIAAARKNAERLNEQTKAGADRSRSRPHQLNPYTDVHKLLDAIDEFGKKYCSRRP